MCSQISASDADVQLLKAELVTRIDEIIRRRGLKQVEAAKLLGLSQSDVSRLLRGSFRHYSVEPSVASMMTLGRDVEIVIRQARSHAGGKLSIEQLSFIEMRLFSARTGCHTAGILAPSDAGNGRVAARSGEIGKHARQAMAAAVAGVN